MRGLGFEVELVDDGLEKVTQRSGRNPSWAVDELLLALDLYLEAGLLDDGDPRVVELSDILNGLPIHTFRPDEGGSVMRTVLP